MFAEKTLVYNKFFKTFNYGKSCHQSLHKFGMILNNVKIPYILWAKYLNLFYL